MGNKKHPGETPQPWALISPNYWACLSLSGSQEGLGENTGEIELTIFPEGAGIVLKQKVNVLLIPPSAQPSEVGRIPARDPCF